VKSAAEKATATTTVSQPRRDVHRLGGHGDRKRDRHDEGDAEPKPDRIDGHRPATRLVETVEELRDLPDVDDPEGERGDHEPEAVDRDRPDREHREEEQHIARRDGVRETGDPVGEHRSAGEHVDSPPDPHVADADEYLRVLGLRQREVELAVAHLLHQPLHVRLDRRLDHAAEQDLDAHHDQELERLHPFSSAVCE
jgi:hypothetical protein